MNQFFKFIFLLTLAFACGKKEVSSGPNDNVDKRVKDLLGKMTLKEKIGQMNQYSVGTEMTGPGAKQGRTKQRYDKLLNGEVGSVLNLLGAQNTRELQQKVVENSRLGIPLIFAYDVIHGYKTTFPIPLGEAASWDLAAIEKSARIAATETAASGIHWTFAPMVDISRDARWGRVMEGAGEDQYLGSLIAQARIKGFQGENLSLDNTILACAKHFAGYGFAESGRDYNRVSVGKNSLFNEILPPFMASIQSDVATFMNAFNDVDGTPSTSNQFLLRELLKGKWGFSGVVVSDWNSVGELAFHGVAKDENQASALAVTAGCDIDMEADAYTEHLEQLVADGVVDEKLIDDAVTRILQLKYRLGLFEDPYKYSDVEREKKWVGASDHKNFAREIASKSIVLLKNDKNLLPLKDKKKIAIIGPLAKDKDTPLGNWRGQAVSNGAVSLYEGIENALGEKALLSYAEGCKLSVGPNNFIEEVVIETKDKSGFAKAINIARDADVVIMTLGETAFMSGEARSRADIGLPGLQEELLQAVFKVNKNVVLVLMNGRPLTIPWAAENIPTILETWHLGQEAGNAIADVLTGSVNPSGKLPMSFPRHVGQLPIYYNSLNTGRPTSDLVFHSHHMDVDKTPLYPFGHGLSYSTFEYSNLNVKTNVDGLKVSIDVKNTSLVDGTEVIQLYIRDLVASVSRPIKELKKFRKLAFEDGETKKVEFELEKKDLSFYNSEGNSTFEPGKFEIFVGTSSATTLSELVTVD